MFESVLPERNLVSIVVPVYNVEEYLAECVNSIMTQTYRQLEILLIDDGSTDSCPMICDQFAKSDSRIKVFHCDNGGLSHARNFGTSKANGDWICYVDSDDVISDTYIETMLTAARRENAPIACCKYKLFSERIPSPVKKGEAYPLDGSIAAAEVLSDKRASTSAWGKLATAKVWRSVKFPEGRRFEDLPVTWKIFANNKRAVLLTDELYFYRKHPGSISSVQLASIRSIVEYDQSIEELVNDILNLKDVPELKYPMYFRAALESCRLYEMCLHSDPDSLNSISNEIKERSLSRIRGGIAASICNKHASFPQRFRIILFAIMPTFAIFLRRCIKSGRS